MNTQHRALGSGSGATFSLTEDVARHLLCAAAESYRSVGRAAIPAAAVVAALARPTADGGCVAAMLLSASQERLRARLAREVDRDAVAAACLFVAHRRLVEGMQGLSPSALAALNEAWGLTRPAVWEIARRLAELAGAEDGYDYAASLNVLYRLAVDRRGVGVAPEGGSHVAQPLE